MACLTSALPARRSGISKLLEMANPSFNGSLSQAGIATACTQADLRIFPPAPSMSSSGASNLPS